ncbi:methionine--tRNA ligase [bacterium]|nr:methionine--tRNA ligase [bacterium]
MSKSFYLTTPLYYVNDEPHLGHAYTTILADVLSRYHRLFGEDVHFLTGTDEHGQKVANAATKAGKDPKLYCDGLAQRFIDVWEQLGISNDDFIRTTEPRHEKIVVDVLNKLNEKGEIYKKDYVGWYSVFEEQFFTEKDLIDGKDPIGHRPVEKIQETNYFFKMSKYQDWLIDYYTKNKDAVLPEFRMNEVLGFLRKPLEDLCISRPKSRLSWGIPIPWDTDYVTYVWFDALLNYYSATLSPPEGTHPTWPADYHLIGKDILTTHAVYWPTMLKAADLEPPKHIFAHGWWLAKDSAKMSKSTGNVIKPLDLATVYGADVFRYVLMREMVLGQDASFSEESFIKRVNSDLANDLGNLVSRVAKIQSKHFPGETLHLEDTEEDEIFELARKTTFSVRTMVENLQIHSAIEETLQFIRAINRDFTLAEPWKSAKSDPQSARNALARALEGIRIASVLLSPIMPNKIQELMKRIGAPASDQYEWEDTAWNTTTRAKESFFDEPVFPRVNAPKQATEKKESPAKKEELKISPDGLLPIERFKEVELKTARIKSAEPVKGTDKLMRLEIDLGSEERQLVAGIQQHYTPEKLVGKLIIVVANLQPAKIRGVRSEGMLLAVRDGDSLNLLTVDANVPPGLKIS